MALAVPQAGAANLLPFDECRVQCLMESLEVFRTCLEEGGEFQDCLMAAREACETCVADCGPSCVEQCSLDTKAMFQECLEGCDDG
jgi:hypothetical protein